MVQHIPSWVAFAAREIYHSRSCTVDLPRPFLWILIFSKSICIPHRLSKGWMVKSLLRKFNLSWMWPTNFCFKQMGFFYASFCCCSMGHFPIQCPCCLHLANGLSRSCLCSFFTTAILISASSTNDHVHSWLRGGIWNAQWLCQMLMPSHTLKDEKRRASRICQMLCEKLCLLLPKFVELCFANLSNREGIGNGGCD